MNLVEYCIERQTNEDILENEFVSIYLLKMELWQFFRETKIEKKKLFTISVSGIEYFFSVKLSEIVFLLNIKDVICNRVML